MTYIRMGGSSPPLVAPHGAASQAQAQKLSTTFAQANDQKAAQYFAIAMGGLIVIFSTLHWSRVMYKPHIAR